MVLNSGRKYFSARIWFASTVVALVACSSVGTDVSDELDPFHNEEAVDSVTFGLPKPTGTNGDGDYCNNSSALCDLGEGDCDSASQCSAGLSCIVDNGAKWGFTYTLEMCAPAHCGNKALDGDETAIDCGGSCSTPGFDCGSYCSNSYWGYYAVGSNNRCSAECPCPSGQGDCDSDAQCTTGNVCISNNGDRFGFPGQEFCVPATCRNGVQDADETFPDCGGPCSSAGFDCSQVCATHWTQSPNGSGSHCTNVCPCPSGQGDCDSDAQCTTGNVCINNNGYKFGFPGQEFCAPETCRNGVQDGGETGIDCGGSCSSITCAEACASYQATYPNGNNNRCTNACPCASGQGDCDSDAQCTTGNVCINNNGDKFGFPGQEFCAPETCRNGIQDAGEEGVDCGGSCSTISCAQYCASYQTKYPNGTSDHCSATCPCALGQGDCDADAQCQPGLICAPNNSIKFGFAPGQEHCVPASCANGVLNDGETAIDCGGDCGSCGQFAGIGDLPGGAFESYAYAVSADGNVVVGSSSSGNGDEAFRWTVSGGMQPLGDLAGGAFASAAAGVSNNGAVVIGDASGPSGNLAFKWTAADGMVSLGDLAGGGVRSQAYGISGNGLVTVGHSSSTNGREAFVHSGTTMTALGDLLGGAFRSEAWATNSDGTVIVGRGLTAAGTEAFRWTQAGGLVSLGDLSGGTVNSLATGVAANGTVIAGDATTASGVEAFRWTSAGGMVGIGVPAGMTESYAYAISAKGDRIVGTATDAAQANNVAFLWTSGVGIQSLQEIIESQGGAAEMEGWTLRGATAISGDGKVIVGYGINPDGFIEGFRAVIP